MDAIAAPRAARSPTPPATRGTVSATKNPIPRRVNFESSPATMRQPAPPPSRDTPLDDSALASVSKNNPSIWTTANLYEFLDWQAGRRGSPLDQRKFKDDAFNFPGLLVFAVMWPKTQFIQLLHSIQVSPKSPGNDPNWRGKTIGFLGDRTSYSPAPQIVELKDRAPWVWETRTICNDVTELDSFYAVPENVEKAPRISVTPGPKHLR